MCRWKIWKRWSPEPLGRAIPSLLISHRQLIVLALTLFFCVIPLASAETSAHVLSTESDYVFSEFLRFSLEAEPEAPVTEVILFYGQVDEPLVRRIYPSFVPGERIDVEYTESLEPGQFAPGTRFRIWWELHTGEDSVRTATTYLSYEDNNHLWHRLSGEHVDTYWYGNGESRAEALTPRAEDVLSRLESQVGVEVEGRISVYIYNDRRHMQRAISPRSSGYDERVMTLGMKVGEDTLLLLGPHRDVELTMAHELSHIVVGMSTDNPYSDLPRWLDEGLAMYAEGKLPADNRQALDRAIRDDALLSVRSLSSYTGRASQVDLFYGEAYSIVTFLLEEYGRERMQELLHLFSTGMRQEEALQRIYGFDLQGLDRRWRESLGLGPRAEPTDPPPSQPERMEGERALCPSILGVLVLPLGGMALALKGADRS